MLETKDLILDKAKFSDWEALYRHVWSRPESAKYMAWKIAASEEEAKARMLRTIQFQKHHDAYLVYFKQTGKPIGFAGIEKAAPSIFQAAGICFGPAYTGKGFGKQTLQCLMQYCKTELGAKEFWYSTREENEASKQLALAMHFIHSGSARKTDPRDGHSYLLLQYKLVL